MDKIRKKHPDLRGRICQIHALIRTIIHFDQPVLYKKGASGAMIFAVSTARIRGLEYTLSMRICWSRNHFAAASACRIPSLFKGMSLRPCSNFALLFAVYPCRIM
jgi:hypothetical protein